MSLTYTKGFLPFPIQSITDTQLADFIARGIVPDAPIPLAKICKWWWLMKDLTLTTAVSFANTDGSFGSSACNQSVPLVCLPSDSLLSTLLPGQRIPGRGIYGMSDPVDFVATVYGNGSFTDSVGNVTPITPPIDTYLFLDQDTGTTNDTVVVENSGNYYLKMYIQSNEGLGSLQPPWSTFLGGNASNSIITFDGVQLPAWFNTVDRGYGVPTSFSLSAVYTMDTWTP